MKNNIFHSRIYDNDYDDDDSMFLIHNKAYKSIFHIVPFAEFPGVFQFPLIVIKLHWWRQRQRWCWLSHSSMLSSNYLVQFFAMPAYFFFLLLSIFLIMMILYNLLPRTWERRDVQVFTKTCIRRIYIAVYLVICWASLVTKSPYLFLIHL